MAQLASGEEPRGWSLVWDFLRDKPIVAVVTTATLFLIHPKDFTDEVLAENWAGKAKPPRFLLESFLLCTVLAYVIPFDLWKHPELRTDLQKAFAILGDMTSYTIAFFASSGLAHLVLGRRKLPFVIAFFLFCYIQGSSSTAAYVVVAIASLYEPPDASILSLLLAILMIIFSLVVTVLGAVSVHRAYKPTPARFILAAVLGAVVFCAVYWAVEWIFSGISSRFPRG